MTAEQINQLLNQIFAAITALSATIGVILLLKDRAARVKIAASIIQYSLPIRSDSMGGFTNCEVPCVFAEIKNVGKTPVYIKDVYLIVNKHEILRPYPHRLYPGSAEKVVIDPGRYKTAVFYGQEILNKLDNHEVDRLTIRINLISELGKKYKSTPLIKTCRENLSDPGSNGSNQK